MQARTETMHGRRRAAPRIMLPAAVVAAVTLLIGGCQRRVVETRNKWAGAPVQSIERYRPPGQRDEGPLENVGEMMFGWTDMFDGEKEGLQAGQIRVIDPDERSSGTPTRRSSEGGGGTRTLIPNRKNLPGADGSSSDGSSK